MFTETGNYVDNYKHKGLRKRLVHQLTEKLDLSFALQEAFNSIPRHVFLDNAFDQHAYEDKAFPIGEGQTISQPYTVAYQTKMLDIKAGEKVLEIGTGSGYQTSIIHALGGIVFSVERIAELHYRAKNILERLEIDAHLFLGDGTLGLPNCAPFDKIIVTAAAPIVPDTLVRQLRIGGFMIIPVGERDHQVMKKITRRDEQSVIVEEFDKFRFVPLIGQKGW